MRRPVSVVLLCSVLSMSSSLAPRVAAGEEGARGLDAAPEFVEQLDAWVEGALERLEIVPALAVVVVHGDRVVVADAWGVADVDSGAPVDADTQFYIASMTKSYVGLLATMLHARGALDLDSSFAEHLHGVELDPAVRADEVLLHDFLTHTSGVDHESLAFRLAYTGQHTPELLWELLAQARPNGAAPLGTYEYTNLGYNILGMIIDRETGVTWQEHLRASVFEPLGMSRTTAYASLGEREGWPLAAPHHGLDPDGVRRLALQKVDAIMQSAGGMFTTPRDMARWLRFQLADGALDGAQLVPAQLVQATQESLVDTPGESGSPFGAGGYGLGWQHGERHGRAVLSHGGGYPGYRSAMAFLPDADLGVAVMVNEDSLGGDLLRECTLQCIDWWLGERDALDLSPLDERAELRDEILAQRRERQAEFAARTWQLGRERSLYVGRFEHPSIGTLEVRDVDGAFEVSLGLLRCVATPYPADETMRVELVPGRGEVLRFDPPEGRPHTAHVGADVFTRVE